MPAGKSGGFKFAYIKKNEMNENFLGDDFRI